jgi:hypothetical protein
MRVGYRLRLDALGCVDEEERAFAGLHGLFDLVAEVDVSRRVDQVEEIILTVVRA